MAPSNVAVDNLLERLVTAAPEAEKEEKLLSKGDGANTSSAKRIKAIRLGHPARQSAGVLRHSLDAILASSDGLRRI